MDFLPRSYYQPIVLLMVVLLAVVSSYAEAPATDVNRIRSIRVIPGSDGPAIEIITTRPITPTITTLKGPSRLVIDLPDSLLGPRKPIDYRSDQIDGIRANQFQNTPPISRVVVDLAQQIGYSWDAAGTRLMIRLNAAAPSPPHRAK